jgi:hypothetical protein
MQYRRGTLNEIVAAVDNGHPLCVRIQWATGGGHFVTIFGYAGNTINIADPYYGYTAMDYASFPHEYYDGGQWTHTYWVRP